MAMARHALADDGAVEDIERREQRRRAVADVIMGHRSGPTLLDRQARLGAVERLDLALLVDREHEAVRRRVEVKADDIAQFGGKERVAAELEDPLPMGSETMGVPDVLART